MRFPNNKEMMRCAYCKGMSMFDQGNGGPVSCGLSHYHKPKYSLHQVDAMFCQSCGGPIILYRAGHATNLGSAHFSEICVETFYPQLPTREKSPDDVRDANGPLADDYDQAVECEPHSLQASAFLLGRCVEEMLVEKCGAVHKGTLGPKIDTAIEGGKIPDHLHGVLQDGFKVARNQSGHVWVDEDGNRLSVDADTVAMCFSTVNALFEYYYVAPARQNVHVAKMKEVLAKKVAGEQS